MALSSNAVAHRAVGLPRDGYVSMPGAVRDPVSCAAAAEGRRRWRTRRFGWSRSI